MYYTLLYVAYINILYIYTYIYIYYIYVCIYSSIPGGEAWDWYAFRNNLNKFLWLGSSSVPPSIRWKIHDRFPLSSAYWQNIEILKKWNGQYELLLLGLYSKHCGTFFKTFQELFLPYDMLFTYFRLVRILFK